MMLFRVSILSCALILTTLTPDAEGRPDRHPLQDVEERPDGHPQQDVEGRPDGHLLQDAQRRLLRVRRGWWPFGNNDEEEATTTTTSTTTTTEQTFQSFPVDARVDENVNEVEGEEEESSSGGFWSRMNPVNLAKRTYQRMRYSTIGRAVSRGKNATKRGFRIIGRKIKSGYRKIRRKITGEEKYDHFVEQVRVGVERGDKNTIAMLDKLGINVNNYPGGRIVTSVRNDTPTLNEILENEGLSKQNVTVLHSTPQPIEIPQPDLSIDPIIDTNVEGPYPEVDVEPHLITTTSDTIFYSAETDLDDDLKEPKSHEVDEEDMTDESIESSDEEDMTDKSIESSEEYNDPISSLSAKTTQSPVSISSSSIVPPITTTFPHISSTELNSYSESSTLASGSQTTIKPAIEYSTERIFMELSTESTLDSTLPSSLNTSSTIDIPLYITPSPEFTAPIFPVNTFHSISSSTPLPIIIDETDVLTPFTGEVTMTPVNLTGLSADKLDITTSIVEITNSTITSAKPLPTSPSTAVASTTASDLPTTSIITTTKPSSPTTPSSIISTEFATTITPTTSTLPTSSAPYTTSTLPTTALTLSTTTKIPTTSTTPTPITFVPTSPTTTTTISVPTSTSLSVTEESGHPPAEESNGFPSPFQPPDSETTDFPSPFGTPDENDFSGDKSFPDVFSDNMVRDRLREIYERGDFSHDDLKLAFNNFNPSNYDYVYDYNYY